MKQKLFGSAPGFGAVEVQDCPPGLAVAVYDVTGDPPSLLGKPHHTHALVLE
jgi:hypothetical protein